MTIPAMIVNSQNGWGSLLPARSTAWRTPRRTLIDRLGRMVSDVVTVAPRSAACFERIASLPAPDSYISDVVGGYVNS
ncbi:hypothetical protein GCM10027294_23110 [Marinactinospora endophytica]